jgi:hypothetical protein
MPIYQAAGSHQLPLPCNTILVHWMILFSALVSPAPLPHVQGGQASMSINIVGMFAGAGGSSKARGERRSMTVAEARPYLEEAEADRQFPAELLSKEAVSASVAALVANLAVFAATCYRQLLRRGSK